MRSDRVFADEHFISPIAVGLVLRHAATASLLEHPEMQKYWLTAASSFLGSAIDQNMALD